MPTVSHHTAPLRLALDARERLRGSQHRDDRPGAPARLIVQCNQRARIAPSHGNVECIHPTQCVVGGQISRLLGEYGVYVNQRNVRQLTDNLSRQPSAHRVLPRSSYRTRDFRQEDDRTYKGEALCMHCLQQGMAERMLGIAVVDVANKNVGVNGEHAHHLQDAPGAPPDQQPVARWRDAPPEARPTPCATVLILPRHLRHVARKGQPDVPRARAQSAAKGARSAVPGRASTAYQRVVVPDSARWSYASPYWYRAARSSVIPLRAPLI